MQLRAELVAGAELLSDLRNADIPLKAVENPVMHKYAKARIKNYRDFAQSVQPWQFGSDEQGLDNQKKRTCFWLKNLPLLKPTGTLDGKTAKDDIHKCPPSVDRWKIRSKFFPGMATAIAEQFGEYILQN